MIPTRKIIPFISCLSFSAFPLHAAAAETDEQKSYATMEVPSDGIERFLPGQELGTKLPESIQGIWWMDGNPLGDILLTLNGSKYDPATRTAELSPYYPGSYTYRPELMNRSAYLQVVAAHPVMVVQFNEDFTFATIVPRHDPGTDSIFLPNPKDVTFTMHLREDGHWVRESYYFGIRAPDYQLRRIVKADGSHDPAYADYLKAAPPTSVIGFKLK